MRMYDIILKKRDGLELSKEEIDFFIKGYTEGKIPDYQASALTMAIFFNKMTDRETVYLTNAMAQSGDRVDLSAFGKLTVDKHSTGGVGDKTTLIVAPIVASLGCKVAKMSGRGLGHTGGTVDKLEAIKGYKTDMGRDEFLRQVEDISIAVIGQSGDLTPADKKLYALRDVTATVDSIPLIVSSIMSKKIAGGSHNIVLDVKVGSGAFMKTADDARSLAENMVKIGKDCGRNIAALITDMDVPLGYAVGNSLEVIEAVKILKNEQKGDLYEVSLSLAAAMVSLTLGVEFDKALKMAQDAIESKAAFNKMKQWVCLQGGDARLLDDTSLFEKCEYEAEIKSQKSGYIFKMDAEKIGVASVILGAGRAYKEEKIDFGAGIMLVKKTGDSVKEGDVLFKIYTNRKDAIKEAEKRLYDAIIISDTEPSQRQLIYDIIK